MAVMTERPRLHLRKGDTVEVIGGKYRGKRGKVLRVLRHARRGARAIVEGVNLVKRHTKPNPGKSQQGGIIEKPAPLPVARLMIVCARCGEAARVGHRFLDDGTKVRYCKHCSEQLEK
uniref:Large ribosomal subunit protein uL24 n=1 Tax=uncultured bacterium Rifle_16ft_4_minimus_7469 TaxID=1665162 RepID=A0A0H4TA06_9BACT|nr:50S ribosomal protein L24, large subunit ribosomal protein L24 [uncultured bacterium Rifle_16ft_4_minimus_7469]